MQTYGYFLFSVICYVVLCGIFIGTFEKKREIKKQYRCFLWLGLVLVNICFSGFFADNLLLKESLMAAATAFAMLVLFQGRGTRILILTLFYHSGRLIIDYCIHYLIMNYVPSIPLSDMTALPVSSGSILLCESLRFYLLLFLKLYINLNSETVCKKIEQLRFWGSICFYIMIISPGIVKVIRGTEMDFGYFTVGLLLINVVLSELLNDLLKQNTKLQKEKVLQEQAEREARMYQTISENYEKQRKREHEYKNQVLCIQALIQEEKYSELKGYLEEVDQKMMNGTHLFDTNHSIINSILNLKYQEARKKDTLFVVQFNDLSGLPIVDEDVVVLLSNLLDNAMEACEQSEHKVIKFKFLKGPDRVILSVRNSLGKLPQIREGYFQTSKTDHPEMHGIGIQNVCEIIEKYGGHYTIEYSKDEFCFSILIYCRGNSITMPSVL